VELFIPGQPALGIAMDKKHGPPGWVAAFQNMQLNAIPTGYLMSFHVLSHELPPVAIGLPPGVAEDGYVHQVSAGRAR